MEEPKRRKERRNQRLKLLYLMKILLEQTDEEHNLTMSEIIGELEKYDVTAERKSIYDALEDLRTFGLDIITVKGSRNAYYIGEREFELPELKFLVDAVQSSKFITKSKSMELIQKLENLGSKYQAGRLQRQVYVMNRVKTMNENVYYNVDVIHEAIAGNSQISFQYWKWNLKKEMELTHGGARQTVSPWALIWEDENYYLVAYDKEAGILKHYRVDKMKNIEGTGAAREGREEFEKMDIARYSRQVFGMFGGQTESVKLRFDNPMIGVILDRFGKDVIIQQTGEDYSEVRVDVVPSPQFYGWIFGLGGRVHLVEPLRLVREMQETARRFIET